MARPQTEGGSVSWGPRGPRGPAGEGRGQKPSPLAAARAGPACRRGLPGSPSHAWLWLVLWMRDLDLGKGLGLSCCRCCPRCPNRPPAGSGRRCPATGAQGQLLCCSARAPGRWAMPGPAGCCNPGLFSSPRPGPTAGACCQGCRHSVPSFLPSSWLLGPTCSTARGKTEAPTLGTSEGKAGTGSGPSPSGSSTVRAGTPFVCFMLKHGPQQVLSELGAGAVRGTRDGALPSGPPSAGGGGTGQRTDRRDVCPHRWCDTRRLQCGVTAEQQRPVHKAVGPGLLGEGCAQPSE